MGAKTENLQKLTVVSFGFFLLFNHLWNRLMEPQLEAEDAITRHTNFIQDIERGIWRHARGIYAAFVSFIYYVQLGLFLIIFPAISLYVICAALSELLWRNNSFSAGLDVSLSWIVVALVVQIIAKLLQTWFLELARWMD